MAIARLQAVTRGRGTHCRQLSVRALGGLPLRTFSAVSSVLAAALPWFYLISAYVPTVGLLQVVD